jgi:hypothetical protein
MISSLVDKDSAQVKTSPTLADEVLTVCKTVFSI